MMDPKEISQKLKSEEIDTLKQSISFVDDRIALMRERAKLAETRATAMLAVSGILAGFVVHFGKTLQSDKAVETVMFAAFYIASVFLLIKASCYAVRVLWVLKGNELTPDLAFDLQTKSGHEALREELTWKIWEYYEILPLTNEKLFWLNRSQRNTVSAVMTFMFLGTIQFIEIKLKVEFSLLLKGLIIFALAFIVLFIDITMERFGGIWHKQ